MFKFRMAIAALCVALAITHSVAVVAIFRAFDGASPAASAALIFAWMFIAPGVFLYPAWAIIAFVTPTRVAEKVLRFT